MALSSMVGLEATLSTRGMVDVFDDVTDSGLAIVQLGEPAHDISEVSCAREAEGAGILTDHPVDLAELLTSAPMATLMRQGRRRREQSEGCDHASEHCVLRPHHSPPLV